VNQSGKVAALYPQIREFREPDFERLWAIDQACFEAALAYSRAELRFYMRLPGAFTLLAEADSGTVGFVVARAMRNAVGHVITIDVLEGARRGGTGSLLLVSAEDRLRQASCRAITLETAVDNMAAMAFYNRHQYSIVRTLRGYYSNGMDALVMQKRLQK
jgi:ribosomal-protein-alanine N-acetyltransferase